MVSSTDISLLSSWLQPAHLVHFADGMTSRQLWIFRGPETCVFFVHEPAEMQMGCMTQTQLVKSVFTLHPILHSASVDLVAHSDIPASSSTTFYLSDCYVFF
jgi:hypothetical protein